MQFSPWRDFSKSSSWRMKPRLGAAFGLLFFTCCRASDKLIPRYFIRYATMMVTLQGGNNLEPDFSVDQMKKRTVKWTIQISRFFILSSNMNIKKGKCCMNFVQNLSHRLEVNKDIIIIYESPAPCLTFTLQQQHRILPLRMVGYIDQTMPQCSISYLHQTH